MRVTAITRFKHGNLWAALGKLNWSQAELARQSGISQQMIGRIINLQRRPTASQADAKRGPLKVAGSTAMAFGGFEQHGGGQPMAEINTTPLVDVMLVLLVIFIITAPLIAHSIKLDLPVAQAPATPSTPETITLSINASGTLFWNQEQIGRAHV